MKTELKDISQCEKELTITIDSQEALDEYNKILNSFKNHLAMPGFRKGKAPLSMIERTYGEHAKEEFYNQKLGDFYKKAIDEKDVKPINQGEATKVEWEKGKDLVATFKFEVMPEIKIEKYKNLKVPFEETKFKKEMVDATIEDFRYRMGNEITPETAEENDFIKAIIKFLDDEGKITKEIEREFILGDNSYSKSFNIKLTWLKVDDEIKTKLFAKDQKTTDNEINEKFINKEFLVKIKSIKRRILPELNDEFAKDLEYNSLKELRKKVTEELKLKLKKENKERMRSSIIIKIIEENPFDVPKSVITNYAESLAKPYVKKYKIELEKIIPMYMGIAEYNLKSHLILEELKKKEKIEITDEDKEEIIKEAADNLKMKLDKYKEMYKKQIKSDEFKFAVEERKLIKFLEKHSKFVPYPKEKKEQDNPPPPDKTGLRRDKEEKKEK